MEHGVNNVQFDLLRLMIRIQTMSPTKHTTKPICGTIIIVNRSHCT